VPALRGVSHAKAVAFAPALGLLLLAVSEGRTARLAALVFSVTMAGMLAASALNHRARLGLRWERRFRRADHVAVLLFLGGTWTSLTLTVLSGTDRILATGCLWGAVLLACLLMLVWLRIPGWAMSIIGLVVAWPPALFMLPHLRAIGGEIAELVFVAGGFVYTIGAVGYALRRPNPHPVFGYHEVFHALVLVGAACHYLTLALFVLPK
jgi:hemolysin III